MTPLPPAYAFLNDEPGPRMLLEALKLHGTLEVKGQGSNPVILAWADEIGAEERTAYAKWAADWYDDDGVAWCGLFMALCAVRSNHGDRPDRRPPEKYLSAAEWARFGVASERAELGDVLVFSRPGGAHVTQYVGEDATTYHCLGGNQGDAVSIARIAKGRCIAIRRPPYVVKPANVRPVFISTAGRPVSTNEA